jgi:hypothetical protein
VEDAVGVQAHERLLKTCNLLVGAVDGLHVGGKGSLGWGCGQLAARRPRPGKTYAMGVWS